MLKLTEGVVMYDHIVSMLKKLQCFILSLLASCKSDYCLINQFIWTRQLSNKADYSQTNSFCKCIHRWLISFINYNKWWDTYFSLSVLYMRAISGTSGSSGLGSHNREQMDKRTAGRNIQNHSLQQSLLKHYKTHSLSCSALHRCEGAYL